MHTTLSSNTLNLLLLLRTVVKDCHSIPAETDQFSIFVSNGICQQSHRCRLTRH